MYVSDAELIKTNRFFWALTTRQTASGSANGIKAWWPTGREIDGSHQRQGNAQDDPQRRRESIDAVQQVDGVDRAQQPEQRKWNAK